MVNLALLGAFIPTFLFVSVTPGMCMTLAMTLGMSQGVRRTLWMMWGEMLGVALVAILAVCGVAAIMLQFPAFFQGFKVAGAVYLTYIGLQMWRAKGKLALPQPGELPGWRGVLYLARVLLRQCLTPKAGRFIWRCCRPLSIASWHSGRSCWC